MAIIHKTATLRNDRFITLHVEVGKKFTVVIDSSEPDFESVFTMRKATGGVWYAVTFNTTSMSIFLYQTLPWGAIGATFPPSLGLAELPISYTVKTGPDA